ncbi:MAG: alkaline phosphatase family protein [Pirellulales bacterium]|nr:alkaline phosphatase family protein [Pirellulales bacterium]
MRRIENRVLAAAFVLTISTGAGARSDNRVLVVGLDGLGGTFYDTTPTPHMDALIAAGAGSTKFLNEGGLVPNPPAGYGASGVNWSTVATGASAVRHGVTDNSFSGNRFAERPHFFKHLKDRDPTLFTASIVNWAPINTQILADPFADLEIGGVSDNAVRDAAVSLLTAGDPHAVFLHFDQVDAAGHSSGWGSVAYRQAIQSVDALVGSVVAAMNARSGVVAGTENWLVIVTSDHGGSGNSHSAGQGLINWEVPFIVSGPSVPGGTTLVPGTLRDVATTALWHMGVDPFSVPVDGRVQGLAFGPPNGIVGDVNQDGVVSGDGSGPPESDDVAAFVRGWLTTGHGSVAEAYAHGDLNLDRVTDLADWIILNRLDPAAGLAVMRALSPSVPEPTGLALGAVALAGAALRLGGSARRRAAQRRRASANRTRAKPLLRALVAAAVVVAGAAPVSAGLSDGLVALYAFEGNLLDTSGSLEPSHAHGVNGPQYAAGKIGQALWLPGVRDHASLPSASGSELDFGSTTTGDAVDFTLAMWVRQDDMASDPAVLSNKNWNSGNNTGVNWAVNGNGIFDLNTKGDLGVRRDLDTAATSAPLVVGAWNLVVATIDRDGPTRLYVNGALRGTIPQSSTGSFTSGLPWTVGQDGTGTYGVDFNGAVDELAIWRRALEESEVAALWNDGAGLALAELTFDAHLKLIVDRDTGAMEIVNNTGAATELLGYQIASQAGALDRAAWQPIAGRLDATGDGSIDADDRWLPLTSLESRTDLSEASLGEGTIPPGTRIDLGFAWRKYHRDFGDVSFLYATPTDAAPLAGIVEFVGNGGAAFAPLDLDFNGAVDAGDYAAFLAGYGTSLVGESAAGRYNRGDLDGDGRHALADFLEFKKQFDAVRGAGAFAQLAAPTIPEPIAGELALIGATIAVAARRSR